MCMNRTWIDRIVYVLCIPMYGTNKIRQQYQRYNNVASRKTNSTISNITEFNADTANGRIFFKRKIWEGKHVIDVKAVSLYFAIHSRHLSTIYFPIEFIAVFVQPFDFSSSIHSSVAKKIFAVYLKNSLSVH